MCTTIITNVANIDKNLRLQSLDARTQPLDAHTQPLDGRTQPWNEESSTLR